MIVVISPVVTPIFIFFCRKQTEQKYWINKSSDFFPAELDLQTYDLCQKWTSVNDEIIVFNLFTVININFFHIEHCINYQSVLNLQSVFYLQLHCVEWPIIFSEKHNPAPRALRPNVQASKDRNQRYTNPVGTTVSKD